MFSQALAALVLAGTAITIAILAVLLRKSLLLHLDQALQAMKRPDDLASFPRVSIVVPVRNEERNVRACLSSLLAFDYPSYEILVADDGSTDGTMKIVAELMHGAPEGRVKALATPEGEPGEREQWRSGKAFVLWQAARHATGEWLLFVDADTRHKKDGLWRAVGTARENRLRAFSASGVYVNPSFLGDLQETVIYNAVFLCMPLRRINDPEDRHMGWANGQFILVEKKTYDEIGGHQAIRSFWMDDLSMGRLVKERGVPFRFLPGAQLFECVNYVGLGEALRGWIRLLAGGTPWLGLGRAFFVGASLAIFLAAVLPFAVAAVAATGRLEPFALAGLSLRDLALGQASLVIAIHALTRKGMKTPVWRAIFLPVGALLALWTFVGGYRVRFGQGAIDFRGRRHVLDTDEIAKAFGS